jgi:hypothetical protein
LASISLRLGRKIRWDAETEEIIGEREASAMLVRPYRTIRLSDFWIDDVRAKRAEDRIWVTRPPTGWLTTRHAITIRVALAAGSWIQNHLIVWLPITPYSSIA